MASYPLSLRRALGTLPIALLILGLFVVLVLMRDAVQNSETLSRAFVPLFALVLAGLLVLAALVVVNIVKLLRHYRARTAGSRLTTRIVVLFAAISLLPIGVVYYFSLSFLLRGIDSWFDVEIGAAMQDALVLNRASLDQNQRILLKYTEHLLSGIEDRSATAIALSLNSLRRQAGAVELTVYSHSGQVLAYASEDPTQLMPRAPEREIAHHLRRRENHVGLETNASGDLIVRVFVNDQTQQMQMQAIFPTSARISELSQRLEDAYNRYTELAYLRRSLKLSFSLTLSLVMLFGSMAALVAAFHIARRLVAPIANIARATRSIAAGDYRQQIPLPRADDDLTFLVASFNAMSRRIANARDAEAHSKQVVEAQRNYLETILGRLSSGVIALDEHTGIRTANPAAHALLELAATGAPPSDLAQLECERPWLGPLAEAVRRHLERALPWREEVTIERDSGRLILMCRGSPLPLPENDRRGHVVVFDDITSLIVAQRNAAWAEVARRLAHEIKNPLTPIQLSAERLRHKLLATAGENDARIIDRATRTIIQQVDAMKAMVNDFSDYARASGMQAEPITFDSLVREIFDLYRSAGTSALSIDLHAHGAQIRGNALRLRQVIHNLVKNALEALEGREAASVTIATAIIEQPEGDLLRCRVADSGPGIEPQMLERLFEPYITSKPKGTGLGLAIVKKIIEEHEGMIEAMNTAHGATIEFRLPLWHPVAAAAHYQE